MFEDTVSIEGQAVVGGVTHPLEPIHIPGPTLHHHVVTTRGVQSLQEVVYPHFL